MTMKDGRQAQDLFGNPRRWLVTYSKQFEGGFDAVVVTEQWTWPPEEQFIEMCHAYPTTRFVLYGFWEISPLAGGL